MYKKVSPNLNFIAREKEVRDFWKREEIFKKSIALRKGGPSYIFYDGPPTANGTPHIGHVLTRAIKDLIPRYRAMKGYDVPRKAGWDTHGLPVELEVEKLLHLDGKEQIEEYGIAPFIEKCKESVWKYKGMWEDFSETVGFWADMENPYVTYHNSFIESEWWALKQIYDRGLLYKGFKIVPYCPRCGTPLSSHEVAQGYQDIKERSAIVRFRLKGEEGSILAWTTTPWTLPSNVALCVNPAEEYVKVRHESGEVFLLAGALCDAVLGEGTYTELERMPGKALEEKEYEPLFAFTQPKEKCWYVTCADFVTLSDGTGVVHIAPAFGEDDAAVGRKYALPFVQLVDAKGEMTAETLWPGVFCKDADKAILQNLRERSLLFSAPVFEHSYPHCWRCGTPLIYYARDSWFIEMTKVKENLLRNNNTINWIPESIGKGRFGDWLENVQDWGISRNRYWGTPLNIWECKNGHRHSVGGIEELKAMSENCPADIELHRPYIDAVTIRCPQCGEEMTRVPEVIDCWFDSGSMPFAQHHYPFENQELFQREFPAAFISEAVDQTRGWFYSLLAISTLIFDQSSFQNVIVMGHVQDENGQKMSKSKGNAVDPFEALETYGADAIRWYFYSGSAPWLPTKFSGKSVQEGQRKFMSTLWNTYAFYVLYANIDQFDPNQYPHKPESLTLMDRWLLSRLNTMIHTVDTSLEHYRVPEAARALQDFVDDMSNWYVRRSRQRFWTKEMTEDKICAYQTLYTALVETAKAAAPMIPFMADDIYCNLVRSIDSTAPESVHLCDFPVYDESKIDADLEKQMELVLEIVALGRAARNEVSIKNRQPLSNMFIRSEKGECNGLYLGIIAEELNVKQVEFVQDTTLFSDYIFKPQLKLLGKKFGKQIGEVREALANLPGQQTMRTLQETGTINISLSTGAAQLTEEEVLVETVKAEGFATVSDRGITVTLNTALTPSLIEEGFVREIISKVQAMRRDADFDVVDHIRLYAAGSEKLMDIIEKNRELIARDVLADAICVGEEGGTGAQWDINGEAATLGVERILS